MHKNLPRECCSKSLIEDGPFLCSLKSPCLSSGLHESTVREELKEQMSHPVLDRLCPSKHSNNTPNSELNLQIREAAMSSREKPSGASGNDQGPEPDGVSSILDTDLYKFTMQCAVRHFFPRTSKPVVPR